MRSEQALPEVGLDLRVRFVETDAMGVVHHSNYLVWFEAARVAWMDAAGMPYAEVAAGGNHFAVTSAHVAYRASARFGDTVWVTAALGLLRSRQVRFDYSVHNLDTGALLATGYTEHICVDLAGKMAKIPAEVMDRLAAGVERLAQRAGALEPLDAIDQARD
jgi:acyl-CoA thioester hydrolase